MNRILLFSLLLIFSVSTFAITRSEGNWRWRADNGTDESATTGDENTAGSLDDFNNLRLRIEYFDSDAEYANQYSIRNIGLSYSTDQNSWYLITTSTDQAFVLSPSSYFSDGDISVTDKISNSAGTSAANGRMTSTSSSFSFTLNDNYSHELEWCIKATSNILPSTTYYFALWDMTINGIMGKPAGSRASLVTNASLPVELSSFTVRTNNNRVDLNWETATEVNNFGFEVERTSKDPGNNDWAKIGFVEGAGNSNSKMTYSFVDQSVSIGKYIYRLKQIDINGSCSYSDEIEVNLELPSEFKLGQNYPNPFNPVTKIAYQLAADSKVVVKVYNILGAEVATLVNEEKAAGSYDVVFDGSNLSSGIYIYSIQAGDFTATKKLTLLK